MLRCRNDATVTAVPVALILNSSSSEHRCGKGELVPVVPSDAVGARWESEEANMETVLVDVQGPGPQAVAAWPLQLTARAGTLRYSGTGLVGASHAAQHGIGRSR